MSSSSFSFSSSDDEGTLQDCASTSEGRIVVAAPRALSRPSNIPVAEMGCNDGAKDRRDRKRRSSGRKRHRKADRRRKRSGSTSESDLSSDDDDRQRRQSRRKHKSKKGRKGESKRDRKKRRKKRRGRSGSRSRSRDDTTSTAERKKVGSVDASSEIRLPKPSTGRSFASVSKSFGEARPPSPKLLMLEDGKVEEGGTRGGHQQTETRQNNVDFVQAYREACLCYCRSDAEKERQSLLLPIDYEVLIGDESDLNLLYLDKQKRLNETVRTNPKDTESWIALANLHQPVPKTGDSNKTQSVGAASASNDIARLERKREILTTGVKNNLECVTLRIALIETLERLCLLSAVPEREVEAESDAAIRIFEVMVAEEYKSCHQGQDGQSTETTAMSSSSNVHGLVAFHRMRLRRKQRLKECTANKMRDRFIEAFDSVSKACGVTEAPLPPEMCVLFLDYLRAEAMLGYSERSVALIQAALEINLYRHTGSDSKAFQESLFFYYWNSESNRIGDVYPHTGWRQWERAANVDSVKKEVPSMKGRKKAKKRLRASDFFVENRGPADRPDNQGTNIVDKKDGTEASMDRTQSLISAYTSASSATQSNETALRSTQQSDKVMGHILGAAKSAVDKQEERKRRREQEELDMFGKNGNRLSSEAAIFAADGTDIAISDTKHPKPTHAYVYSFILNKRIEVSLDELSGEATKNSLRTTLVHLRTRKKKQSEANKSSNVIKSADKKLHIIQEDDIFLRWAMEEARTQQFVFSLPKKSLDEQERTDSLYDPNETVWLEDGIQWIVTPYLSHFSDGSGVPLLVSVCLKFLGVTFPRSLIGDSFEMERYVLGTSGGERLDQSILSKMFDGVLKPSEGRGKERKLSGPFFVYRQLLFDESLVAFDERIFNPDHTMQRKFVRNCLYSIATSSPDTQAEGAESELSWRSYIQIALIAFEARASGEKATEVAQSILAGTKQAKCDPRLFMAYAVLDCNLRLSRDPSDASKAFKPVSKFLLRALEAGGSDIFRSPYSPWWLELALMALRSMMNLPIGTLQVSENSSSDFTSLKPAILSPEERDRILHIICCTIEGSYQPLPDQNSRKKSKGNKTPLLVDDARVRKCMLNVRTKISSNHMDDIESLSFNHQQSAEAFDRTPTSYYFAILSAWLAALDPNNCKDGGIDFTSGISVLDDFVSVKADRSAPAFQTFLVRIAQAKLELSILRFQESQLLPASPSFADCLVRNIAQLKCLGIVPSRSLMLAVASLEIQDSQQLKNSFGDLLIPGLEIGGIHPNEILFVLRKAVAAADKTISGPFFAQPTSMPRCSYWTNDGRKMVEQSILSVIDRSAYCCYPSLYSVLLHLSLLGSIQSKRPSRAFHKVKDFYHNIILPGCSFSKSLWLDAFTFLRPTYNEIEMVYHMAAMEEKDVRLRKGLEGVMRIAGA